MMDYRNFLRPKARPIWLEFVIFLFLSIFYLASVYKLIGVALNICQKAFRFKITYGVYPAWQAMAGELVFLAIAAASAIVLTRIAPIKIGLVTKRGRPGVIASFSIGALGGLGTAAISACVLLAADLYQYRLALAGQGDVLFNFGAFVSIFIGVGLLEELVWRGVIYGLAEKYLSQNLAVWIGAVAFTAAHAWNPGESLTGMACLFVFALVCSEMRRLSGTIWLGVGFHAAWDFFQSYILGVQDSGVLIKGALGKTITSGPQWLSGGQTGLEGSLVALSVMICAGILALRLKDATVSRQQIWGN